MSNTPPTKIGFDKIGQVAVPVSNIEEAIFFYRDILGMQFLFQATPIPEYIPKEIIKIEDCLEIPLLLKTKFWTSDFQSHPFMEKAQTIDIELNNRSR
jgi:catechol 2,3-dioxygenase-like lactoylglutathione lyase family enzyme